MINKLVGLFLIILVQDAFPQSVSISGTVKDGQEALPGASIIVQGTTLGSVTDIEGNFTLSVQNGAILEISFIGYITQTISVDNRTKYDVVLKSDVIQLDEMVVIGYGAVKKRDVTGSVVSLKAEDILSTVVSSLDQGLQGKAAGVVITQSSGQPGATSFIKIRGTSSINGENEPLYVIDGVPIETSPGVGSEGAVQGPGFNPLASINANDVKSVEILKDASATAIYGTRGANGVILVTTKTGEGTKGSSISIDISSSLQQIREKLDLLNASELAILANEAADNAGVARRLIYASPTNLGVGTDWQDEIFRNAWMNNFQFSARGSNETTSYSISSNYFSQDGIIIGSDFKKGNLRINLNQKLKKTLSIGTSLNLNRSVLNAVITDSESAIPSSVTSWVLEINPGLPVYDDNGDFTFENNTSQPAVGNPVADVNQTDQISMSNRVIGNIYLEWDVFKDISFKSSLGTDAFFNKEKSFIPNNIQRGEASNGQAALGDVNGVSWLLENIVSINKQVQDHNINAVIGHTMQAYKSEFLFVATSDFEDNRLGFNAIQVGSKKTLLLNGTDKWQLNSYLGRVNYKYKEKYLLTISTRVDGASKFGIGNKYGAFPSFAGAWRIVEEDFMRDNGLFDDFKLRIGYGRVGNEGIPSYSSLGLLATTEAYFGESEIAKGSGPLTRENAKLKWETTDQLNIGLDVGVFDGRINLVLDLYSKKTRDLLLDAPVPYTSGYKSAFFNVGNLENKGLEISLNTVNVVSPVKWSSAFNMAFNKNKITKLTGRDDIFGISLLGISRWTRITEGQPIGNFYGYQSDGIIQSSEGPSSVPYFNDYSPSVGDRKYVDQNNDGVLNVDDEVSLGNANPDFSFGLSNNFEYKNWSLSISIQGVYGNEIVNFNRFGLESFDGNRNNSTVALNRWTPENSTNEYPRANATPRVNTLSDVQVEDGSYLRIKDITLGYYLPEALIKKLKLQSCKLYISTKNLVTITNYSGYDPEVSRFNDARSFGADYGTYPTSKIFTTGINISF